MKSYHAHQQCFIINMKVEAFIFQTTLKAKVSARLHLHTEVRTIHARLGNKYQHIEELIKNIQP